MGFPYLSYPSPTAGNGKPTSNSEPNFIRCRQCGFVLDKTKYNAGGTRGLEGDQEYEQVASGVFQAIINEGDGCPHCGSRSFI